MKSAIVYKVTCVPTGKLYFGVTCNGLVRRWRDHVKDAMARRNKSVIGNAIRKYGAEQFTIEIVYEAIDSLEANMVERGLIAAYGTLVPRGMNLSTGGELWSGVARTEISRKRLSDTVKTQWADPKFREDRVAAFQDRVIPDSHVEHLRALAAAKKGKPHSPEHAAKIAAALRGKKHTPERIAKIKANRTPHVWTEEEKIAMGKRVDAAWANGNYDHVDKSAVAKARWADPEFRAKFEGKKRPGHSAKMTELWSDPEYRSKTIKSRKEKTDKQKLAQIVFDVVSNLDDTYYPRDNK